MIDECLQSKNAVWRAVTVQFWYQKSQSWFLKVVVGININWCVPSIRKQVIKSFENYYLCWNFECAPPEEYVLTRYFYAIGTSEFHCVFEAAECQPVGQQAAREQKSGTGIFWYQGDWVQLPTSKGTGHSCCCRQRTLCPALAWKNMIIEVQSLWPL